MKKEIFAALLLLLLILGAGLNSAFYKRESEELSRSLSFSGRYAAEGDREKALSELGWAYKEFSDIKIHLSLFSGEEAADRMESLFLELRGELGENNLGRCSALYSELLISLKELREAQSLKLEAIF